MLNFNLYYTNIAQLAALKCEEFFLWENTYLKHILNKLF